MKVKLIIISIILLLVIVFACGCIPFMENLGILTPPEEEQLSPEKGGPPDGLVKVLIGFKQKPGSAEQELVKGVGGKIKYTYNLIPAIAAAIPEVAIEALQKNPNVTQVEFDSMVYALLDSELDNSWGVNRIGAGFVHEYGNKGAGVEVAIIDTGIDYYHEDLDANYKGGWDFVNKDSNPMDDNGHGTHVAGIIAAEHNHFGVVGVAPEASLYALKVLGSNGSGYVSDVILAIQWASDPDGDGSANDRLDIINMSLGGKNNIFLEWACNLAYNDGLLLVAAAGNGGAVIYPAAYSSVIAVSATDSNDKLAWFSSTGTQVEFAAPGVAIYSTYIGGYATLSGTSMASPHVAGTAALVWAANTTWSNDYVRTQLQSTAENIGLSTTEQGYGLVDAAKAAGVSSEEPEKPMMHVSDITFSAKKVGKNLSLYTKVTVLDSGNNPLGGVRVEMTLIRQESGSSWKFVGNTTTDGTVKFTLNKASSGLYTATVTNLTLTGYTWDNNYNTESCTLTKDGKIE